MKLEDIRLVHALPGRIRFKIDGIKGNPEQARDIESRLATIPGMHHVEANSMTGSVVASFDPALLESLDFHCSVATALAVSPSDLNPEYLAKWYANQSHKAHTLPHDLSVNWRMLVPFTMLALGLRGVLMAERLIFPQWYEYLWYAFGTYFTLNPSTTSAERVNEQAS